MGLNRGHMKLVIGIKRIILFPKEVIEFTIILVKLSRLEIVGNVLTEGMGKALDIYK